MSVRLVPRVSDDRPCMGTIVHWTCHNGTDGCVHACFYGTKARAYLVMEPDVAESIAHDLMAFGMLVDARLREMFEDREP